MQYLTITFASIKNPLKAVAGIETQKQQWKNVEYREDYNSQNSIGQVLFGKVLNCSITEEVAMVPVTPHGHYKNAQEQEN